MLYMPSRGGVVDCLPTFLSPGVVQTQRVGAPGSGARGQSRFEARTRRVASGERHAWRGGVSPGGDGAHDKPVHCGETSARRVRRSRAGGAVRRTKACESLFRQRDAPLALVAGGRRGATLPCCRRSGGRAAWSHKLEYRCRVRVRPAHVGTRPRLAPVPIQDADAGKSPPPTTVADGRGAFGGACRPPARAPPVCLLACLHFERGLGRARVPRHRTGCAARGRRLSRRRNRVEICNVGGSQRARGMECAADVATHLTASSQAPRSLPLHCHCIA
jgi:hypothetical protein